VPMVDLASRVMIGQKLKDLGYGTGLCKTPPYCAVKVPVFSFEKLTDANSYLSPEMKSTGEVLGLGKDVSEALFKGLISSGIRMPHPGEEIGVLLSVSEHDYYEVLGLARKLHDLQCRLYATEGTAQSIATLGIPVTTVADISDHDAAAELLESGKVHYIMYTGALMDSTLDDYIALHRKALMLNIACLTSLDTANALVDIIASRYNQMNTELIDINHMRDARPKLSFMKMHATGNDYILIDDFDAAITYPEALCVRLCRSYTGVAADGIILVEASDVADAKMRIYNRDGSEGRMRGNGIRCVGKYLHDSGKCVSDELTIETAAGVKQLKLYTRYGKVSSALVSIGKADLNAKALPCTLPMERVIDQPVEIGGEVYNITCLSVGTPHCVVFTDKVDTLDLKAIGPMFENAEIFPERVNTEFVRIVNPTTLRMRCFERGSGETMACGTGACAAVVAAVENGHCQKGVDINVHVKGGILVVNYSDEGVTLLGNAELVYEGMLEL